MPRLAQGVPRIHLTPGANQIVELQQGGAAASLQVGKDGGLRHLLTTEGLSAEMIRRILDTADQFVSVNEREVKKVPLLRGKSVFNLFFENSTRTRTTFEIAAKRLSADVINLNINKFRQKDDIDAVLRQVALGKRHGFNRLVNRAGTDRLDFCDLPLPDDACDGSRDGSRTGTCRDLENVHRCRLLCGK